jgi:hypothetical protein
MRRPLATLGVLFLLAAPAAAQIPFDGSEVFRFALHMKGLKPLTQPGLALGKPNGTMIVIVGDTSQLATTIPSLQLREYVLQGGAVLIATDRNPQMLRFDRGWGDAFGITVTGQQLRGQQQNCYGNDVNRPFVWPHMLGRPVFDPQSPYLLFEGLLKADNRAVATDKPSEMRVGNPPPLEFTVDALADYAPGTQYLRGGAVFDRTFAVSLQSQRKQFGRLLVFANGSVFANGMMGFRKDDNAEKGFSFDNGNWELANRTIDWLKRTENDGERSQCLFIENGKIIDQFAIPIPPKPKPPIPELPPEVMANLVLTYMNPLIDEAQKKNFFNRVIEGWLGFPRLLRWFIILMTILFLFTCLRWMIRGRSKIDPRTTMTPNAQAGLLPRGGVVTQRTAAQIEVGNLYEAASRRVRDRFDVLGARPGADGHMPAVLIAGDVPDWPILRRTVEWLWTIGYGGQPVNIPTGDWDRMNSLLERVMVRASRGDWSFGQAVA